MMHFNIGEIQSTKFTKDFNKLVDFDEFEEDFKEKNFIPKLKSKQLLREPKFFFSLERKKIKNQTAEPLFQNVKVHNPEMKEFKTKTFYSRLILSRKLIMRESLMAKDKVFSLGHSFEGTLQKSSSKRKSQQSVNKQKICRNFSISESKSETFLMRSKRPNVHENLNFLINRKKEIKNKNILIRINQSKRL